MDQLIRNVSELAAICAPLFSLADLRSRCADNGTSAAVRDHDTPALFDWLAEVLSCQGVSDALAERYMDEHGSISFHEVQNGLRQRPSCPRLTSYWQFAECGRPPSLARAGSLAAYGINRLALSSARAFCRCRP